MPFVKRVNAKNLQPAVNTQKIFIGRTNELHFFVEHILKPEDPSYNIVSVSGEGGVGKSTLLAQFIDETRLPPFKEYCLTAFVHEQQTTPYTIMEKFAAQLSEVGAPLNEFEKALTRYKEAVRKLQIEREAAQDSAVRETVDLVGTVAEEVPVVGGVLHKGANIATELYLKERRTRQFLKDTELLEDPMSDLTKVFVEELNQLTDKQVTLSSNRMKRCQRIILFFDTFEQLASEVAPWLLDHFLQASISTNVVIVIAGRDSIEQSTPSDPKRWLRYRDNDIIYLINLDSFTEDETRAYLAERGITDPSTTATIWQLSRGLPLYLGLLTFNLQGNVDPTADVVANFLRWIPEQEHIKRRVALDVALFSRPFNQDDLAAFTYVQEDERTTLYRWLIRLPFVRSNPQDGRHRYHDLAQEMFRRDLYQRSQKEYYATRRALALYYKQLLEQTQKEAIKDSNPSAEYLELTLALAYQLFYLPDEASHINGIEQVLNTYRHTNSEQDKEIVRFLREVPYEQQNSKMSTDGSHTARQLLQFIEANVESQQQKLIEAVSDLIKKVAQKATFSLALLAWIYDKRGDAYRNLEEYQRAIADYDCAIELDPTSARAYNSRGIAYNNLKEYQRAIADYDRAIELDPTSALYYDNRGIAYNNLKEYQRAIADYDQAIELDPTYARAYNSRGIAYNDLKEYQQAIADYDRAIVLEPTDATAYNNRGLAYASLKEYRQAIADYDRAIELDANYAPAYYHRGLAYLWLKNIEQARVNFRRRWELNQTNPNAAWMAEWIDMGKESIDIGIAEKLEAIAASNPEHYAAYACRGVALGLSNKLQEGLAMLEQAISLEPEEYDAYFWKGMICAYMDGDQNLTAVEALKKALAIGLPTVLLAPLHWLERDRPDFYKDCVIALLNEYEI